MMKNQHEKIIAATAKDRLKPLGFQQKGRSRFWFKDNGWYANYVEFQPMSQRIGTSANFGISWLWYPRDHWAYSIGERQNFVEYNDDHLFQSSVSQMVSDACAYAHATSEKLSSLECAYAFSKQMAKPDWGEFDLGILAALTGRVDEAKGLFGTLSINPKIEWQKMRHSYVQDFIPFVSHKNQAKSFIATKVEVARDLLGLPKIGPDLFMST